MSSDDGGWWDGTGGSGDDDDDPFGGPEPAPPAAPAQRVLRSALRTIVALVISGLVAFGVAEVRRALRSPTPTGTITVERSQPATRAAFYRLYARRPEPTSGPHGAGSVLVVRTTARHASTCQVRWTAFDVARTASFPNFYDRAAGDVAGTGSCNGTKRLWLPLPCVAAGTILRYELTLDARGKLLGVAWTKKFPAARSC